jgi:dolichol-phosphate mannosyltransferase
MYNDIPADFYDEQLKSRNPLRRWFHANRGRIVDSFVKDVYAPGMKILDIGAGSCCWNADKLPVFGIDLNQGLLSYGKEKGRITEYKIADILDSGLPEKSFDIAVASEVLEHIVEADKAVQQAYGLLKDGGTFILSVPHDTALSAWRVLFFLQVFFRGYILRDAYYRRCCGHVQHFSLASACRMLAANGFTIESAFSVGTLDIFISATKNKRSHHKNKKYKDLTIIIPVLNEARRIGDVLKNLLELYPGVKIVVSDDGSRDGTIRQVKEIQEQNPGISLRDRSNERIKGLTISVLDAVKMVETKYFLVMDGDGQHPGSYVSAIYNHLVLGARLCVGTRAAVPGWQWDRKMLSRAGSLLGKLALRLRKKNIPADILSGFWGVETATWKRVTEGKTGRFYLKGYKILFDFLKLCDPSIKIENAYFSFCVRSAGESKANLKVYFEYARSLMH